MIKLIALLLGGAKFGKFLVMAGTMLLSIAAYAWFYGWPYAVGFVLLIFVHELGHYVAARQRGLRVGLPTFIPFVGAWVELKDQPINPETEAYIGFAGPLAGSIAALLCYFAARQVDSGLLLALAYAGFFLNLFNLIPLPPFDGGRITLVLSPKIWLVGVPMLLAIYLWRPSPLLILMALMAAPQVWKVLRPESANDAPPVPQASLETRLTYGCFYLGLAAFLAIMCFDLDQVLAKH